MSHLALVFLGQFQVCLADKVVTAFESDKVRALLAYLTVEWSGANGQDMIHSRSALAALLWPGYSEESARASLRQTLYHLRKSLGDDQADERQASAPLLLVNRQTIQLNPQADCRVDVRRFIDLLAACAAHPHEQIERCQPCLQRLRQAIDLYQGDFLAGFSVADSDPFEEWRRITQEYLHLQALAALTHLANAAEAAGEAEQALQDAHRQLALEPWREEAHRQVMRVLARRGARTAALAQYNTCRQVLTEELGVEPEGATTALYEQIHSGEFDKERGRRGDKETRRQGEQVTSSLPFSPSPPHNLPTSLTPLLGRAQALAEIASQLQQPHLRLLTLVGAGGMGKTRLALEVGRAQLPAFADGVFFVALASLSTATALAPAIAAAIGSSLPGSDPRVALLQGLRQKQMLLILDNFEHLLGELTTGGDLVVDLLQTAPGVQIIVTSRERLTLRGEQLYSVQPLAFSLKSTLPEASAAAAVRLFVHSAQRVQANFTLDATSLSAVLRICQLVQGMPLGLELAAANVGALPLSEIADEIEQSTEFLASDWRDAPERQRSMRAVFTWSWQLLNAAEQRTLRQIAVFRGGFTRAAAQAVAGASLPVLTRLIHKSLLQWQETAESGGRYAIHELLRQLAEEQLQVLQDEGAAVAARHSDYYLAFVAEQEKRMARNELRQAADAIQSEINNIRPAWLWAAAQAHIEALGQAAYGLWQFYDLRGSRAEGEQMLRLAVQHVAAPLADAPGAQPIVPNRQRMLSKLLALYAGALVVQGKYDTAATTARQAIALGQAHDGVEGETLGSFALGQALVHLNQFAEARPVLEETVQLARRYGLQYATSEILDYAERMAYDNLAFMTFEAGDYPGSRAYLLQSLRRAQTLGKEKAAMNCLFTLASFACSSGDYPTARQKYEQAFALAQTLEHQLGEAYTLVGLAQVLRLQGEYTRAQVAVEQGLTLAHQLGDAFSQVTALADLSRLHCLLGKATNVQPWLTQLNQFLVLPELNPGRRLYILDLLAFHAQLVGEAPQALAYAEQAWQKAQEFIGYGRAQALVTLGQAQAGVQQWDAAVESYQQAIAGYAKLSNAPLAVEPRAGLAQVALAQGDLDLALQQVEAILPVLAEHPRAGFNTPFFAYLTCYRVLAANSDRRAGTVLQTAHDLLQQDAATIQDAALRHAFLENVAMHQALQQTFAALRA